MSVIEYTNEEKIYYHLVSNFLHKNSMERWMPTTYFLFR